MGAFLALVLLATATHADLVEENGTFHERADYPFIADSVTVNQLFVLKPRSVPANPIEGLIYFDSVSRRLMFYDGVQWNVLSYLQSNAPTTEKTQASSTSAHSCANAWGCAEWGDCINDYQTRTCLLVDTACNAVPAPAEEQACVSDFELEGAAGSQSERLEGQSQEQETSPSEPAPEEQSSGAEEEAIPENLFDITFALRSDIIERSQDLSLVVTLQNFGTRYVPARLVYIIYDENGRSVHSDVEETRVYTDQSFIKTFTDLDLNEGNYEITLTVQYAGITEEFSQPFEIRASTWTMIKNLFARGMNK